MATDPESIVYNGACYLIKNQILSHNRLVSQIRGLIQSGDIDGNVNSDGTVFIEGTLTGTDRIKCAIEKIIIPEKYSKSLKTCIKKLFPNKAIPQIIIAEKIVKEN